MRAGSICLFTLLCCEAVFSQSAIKGKIIDRETRQPLEYALVTLEEKGGRSLSDEQGNFELRTAATSDSLRVSFIGYQSRVIGLKKSGNVYLIEMERGAIDLKAVTVLPLPNNAAFSTISNIDLNLHPVNSAQDLMRLVPGLSLMEHQGGGIAEHIFFRGFDADHGTDVSVSVDGMPLNMVSHAHGQGFSDLHFLIPELVTNLEYGKGPYYSDHGDFTTAGYLNFKTADMLNRSEVKLEGGQFNTGRLMAAVNLLSDKARKRGESAYIAGEGFYTDGPFNFAQHFNRTNLFAKYLTNISAATQLRVTLSTFSSLWRSSGEIPARAVDEGLISRWGYIDSTQGGNTNRSMAIVRLTTALSDRLSLENQVYYTHYFFNLNYDETFFADDSVNGDQLRQRESRDLYGYNGRLSYHRRFDNSADLISTAGLGTQLNNIHGSELSHTKDFNQVLEYLQLGNVREWTTNAYLDENYRTGKWLLNGGLRLDYLHFNYLDLLNPRQGPTGKAVFSPKLNVEYAVNDKMQVYAKTGKGFHSNDVKVVAENKGIDVLPAAYGADLGLNWKPIPQLYLNASVWYLFLQQEFVYNGDDGSFSPGDQTGRKGIDLSARYEFTRWLFGDFDINLCKARDIQAPKGQAFLPLSVPFYSSAGLYIKLPGGVNGGVSGRLMKDRPANEDNSLIAKGYFLTDLTANYTKPTFEVGLEIQNLFNTKWRDAQYEVESRLKGEPAAVDDISFTPGMPFFAKLKFALFF
jgi:CarboxypepD_reg-like domain/TonB-dependent Receptor Plug Domain